MLPQVTGDKTGEDDLPTRRTKRPAECIGGAADDEVSKRQRAWLRRNESSEPASWRPVKLHRRGVRARLLAHDNQIKNSTRFEGLSHFSYTEEWGDWREWPQLTLSIDLGSDGVGAWHALGFHFHLNGVLYPDESHSCKNAFLEFAKALDIWDLLLILLVSWNLEFGPRQEESRRSDLRCALESCYKGRLPSQTPLFLEYLPRMVAELEAHDIVVFPRDRSIEEEVWEWLSTRNRYGTMGRRVCTTERSTRRQSRTRDIGRSTCGNELLWRWRPTSWATRSTWASG